MITQPSAQCFNLSRFSLVLLRFMLPVLVLVPAAIAEAAWDAAAGAIQAETVS